MRKVCYGIAIPTALIAGVIAGHVACKNIYIRVFRGSNHLHERSVLSISSWVGIALTLWVVAWVIAESIPSFNDLLSLVSSLFGSVFSYILPAVFFLWLHLNKGRYFSTPAKGVLILINIGVLAIGFTICGLGLYVSGKSINGRPISAGLVLTTPRQWFLFGQKSSQRVCGVQDLKDTL